MERENAKVRTKWFQILWELVAREVLELNHRKFHFHYVLRRSSGPIDTSACYSVSLPSFVVKLHQRIVSTYCLDILIFHSLLKILT